MALSKRFFQIMLFFLGMAVVLGIDQFLKNEIRQNGGFFTCNKGISFGIQMPFIFFSASLLFFGLVLGICLYLYKKSPVSSLLLLSLTLLGGGAASNLIDRFFWGCVLDYIPFLIKGFPLFNVADVGIFLGTFILFFILIFKNIHKNS